MALLDIVLTALHVGLILFCLGGWISRRTRRLHLAVISLVLVSWFGLGAWYGFGYCPLVDWHWQVKRHLGETDLPASFVKYLLDRVSGVDCDPVWVDRVVLIAGVGAFALSLGLAARDRLAPHPGRRSPIGGSPNEPFAGAREGGQARATKSRAWAPSPCGRGLG